jgi:hypothetical protein
MCWEPFARNSLGKPEEGARALSDRFTTASRHPLSANQTAALGQSCAFVDHESIGSSAPIAAIRATAVEPHGSAQKWP